MCIVLFQKIWNKKSQQPLQFSTSFFRDVTLCDPRLAQQSVDKDFSESGKKIDLQRATILPAQLLFLDHHLLVGVGHPQARPGSNDQS